LRNKFASRGFALLFLVEEKELIEKSKLLNITQRGSHCSVKFRNFNILQNADLGNPVKLTSTNIAEFFHPYKLSYG